MSVCLSVSQSVSLSVCMAVSGNLRKNDNLSLVGNMKLQRNSLEIGASCCLKCAESNFGICFQTAAGSPNEKTTESSTRIEAEDFEDASP